MFETMTTQMNSIVDSSLKVQDKLSMAKRESYVGFSFDTIRCNLVGLYVSLKIVIRTLDEHKQKNHPDQPPGTGGGPVRAHMVLERAALEKREEDPLKALEEAFAKFPKSRPSTDQ